MKSDHFESFCEEVVAKKKEGGCVCIHSRYLTDDQLQKLRVKFFVIRVPYQEKMWMIC